MSLFGGRRSEESDKKTCYKTFSSLSGFTFGHFLKAAEERQGQPQSTEDTKPEAIPQQ